MSVCHKRLKEILVCGLSVHETSQLSVLQTHQSGLTELNITPEKPHSSTCHVSATSHCMLDMIYIHLPCRYANTNHALESFKCAADFMYFTMVFSYMLNSVRATSIPTYTHQ